MMSYPQFLSALHPVNINPRRCPTSRTNASKRFLIIKLSALGDILMATPLAAALREADPKCHITWLVHKDNLQMVDANPDIDEVISWDSDFWKDLLCERWKKMLHPRRFLGIPWLVHAFRALHDLRKLKIDTLISMHPEFWPTLVFGTAAKQTLGIFESTPLKGRFRQYDRLYTTAYRQQDFLPHRTDKYLLPLKEFNLIPPIDKQMRMGFTTDDAQHISALLRDDDDNSGRPVIALAPMTTWPTKNWPAERYAVLGDELVQNGYRVVLVGTAKEQPTVQAVADMMTQPVLVLAGSLQIRQLAALIAQSAVLVSGDTAPMHIAAALGTPYVAMFGPTRAEELAPFTGIQRILRHSVACGPCGLMVCPNTGDENMLCLKLVTTYEVMSAITSLLPGKTTH